MRGQAINTYFHENCWDVSSKKFWNAIKHFMSSSKNQNRTCLFENNRIINDDSETRDIFNAHSASVSNDVGGNDCIQIDESIDDINNDFSSHSSVAKIKEHVIPTYLLTIFFMLLKMCIIMQMIMSCLAQVILYMR